MFEAFAEGGGEEAEAFADGLGAAGEVDDEGAAAGAGGGAGEDGGGGDGEGFHAHDLAEARELAVEDGAGGLGCDIAGRGAGAAGGDDEVAVFVVAELDENGGKFPAFVGEEAGTKTASGNSSRRASSMAGPLRS